jgi:hypothetical protein
MRSSVSARCIEPGAVTEAPTAAAKDPATTEPLNAIVVAEMGLGRAITRNREMEGERSIVPTVCVPTDTVVPVADTAGSVDSDNVRDAVRESAEQDIVTDQTSDAECSPAVDPEADAECE